MTNPTPKIAMLPNEAAIEELSADGKLIRGAVSRKEQSPSTCALRRFRKDAQHIADARRDPAVVRVRVWEMTPEGPELNMERVIR